MFIYYIVLSPLSSVKFSPHSPTLKGRYSLRCNFENSHLNMQFDGGNKIIRAIN